MGCFKRGTLLTFGLIGLIPTFAYAGMPAPTLTDVRRFFVLSSLTRGRLEAISFFLVCIFLSAWAIQAIWNSLRKDFPILPRISYGKSLGVVVLWGLLFVLVLTMISGARELMTPGAWEKNGLTYRLTNDASRVVEDRITERNRAVERLRDALVAHARSHDRAYPSPNAKAGIPDALWQVPGLPGRRYVYRGGVVTGDILTENDAHAPTLPLAYEPDEVGSDRLVILTDGSVRWLPASEVERMLHEAKR